VAESNTLHDPWLDWPMGGLPRLCLSCARLSHCTGRCSRCGEDGLLRALDNFDEFPSVAFGYIANELYWLGLRIVQGEEGAYVHCALPEPLVPVSTPALCREAVSRGIDRYMLTVPAPWDTHHRRRDNA
jgi:hypothetical protein